MPLEYGGAAVGFLRQRDAGPGRTNGIQYPMALRISSSSLVRSEVTASDRLVLRSDIRSAVLSAGSRG